MGREKMREDSDDMPILSATITHSFEDKDISCLSVSYLLLYKKGKEGG